VLNNEISGVLNGTSPNPVTMREFAKTLGKVLHRPSFFTVPEFVLKLAVGEGAQSILSSLRVIPQKLIKNSFKFKYDHLEPALNSLLLEI
jgi:NAD dependent epimerase/dehydratase family enzyme